MSTAELARPGITLEDKYEAESGPVLITGVQALVRVALDQRRLDVLRGLNTRAFVSGYPGSPLAGLDRELQHEARRVEAAGIVFRPGLNEELAATAVAGTQLLGELAGRRHDGVTGYWYGKAPGLDRAADAIRHGNLSGTAPLGGAVAWIGDDPSAKSSTVPSSSEPMCRSLLMPLLAPGTVAEELLLGLHAVAMSRHSGLWSALKVVADIADATSVVELDGILDEIVQLDVREATRPPILLPPANLDAEHDQMTVRLARAGEYARHARLNRIVFEPARPRIAIVAAGVAHQAVIRALHDLGLDDAACDALGLRLVQLRMPWPLERDDLRMLLEDVETVLVVEDKLEFLETLVRDALYRRAAAPAVLGRLDADGAPLLSPRSTLGADDVAQALGRVLGAAALPEQGRRRLERIAHAGDAAARLAPLPKRTPYFCSGCPHNVSTLAEADELVGAGIGCHVMIALEPNGRRGKLVGMPQMGGEGAQWLGLEPFTDDPHFVQNLGDGTYHHSGSLALRAATAAGAHITYKLLYNDAVAMTGGQMPEGLLSVPALTRSLALEGVKRIVVTTPDPGLYRGVSLDPIASVRHRDEIRDVERELAQVDGVTVLIHDDRCATEKRRLRKRGKLEAPAERVVINERVCEGCGDCGEKSSCLSVLPVDTPFGRKTQIHQSSCNQDFTCLKGDCPSFVMVTPKAGATKAQWTVPEPPSGLPEPVALVPRELLIRMPGVGGTGVVTVSQILQMAAHLDGRFASGLEQIGLAQKGGPVISDIRISDRPVQGQLRAGAGSADLLLGFDLLGAAARETLAVTDTERTVAVVSTAATPTAQMVVDNTVTFPARRDPVSRIERATRPGAGLFLDAETLSERLFGSHLPANMLLAGAAYQHGCIPISLAAIERAIELNGTGAATNLAAFAWGRAVVADPAAVERATSVPDEDEAEPGAAELVAYQGPKYAGRFQEAVDRVAAIEFERTAGTSTAVAEAFARGLFKLMAYKDEYEVARLHLASSFAAGDKVQVLLQPPLLRSLGLRRKLKLGRGAKPLLRLLAAGRRLRGTPVDPFGHTRMRRLERALIEEYTALVDRALAELDANNAPAVAAIADLPDVIRGYEEIKLRNVELFRASAAELLARLEKHEAALPEPLHVTRVA